jgi:ferric-dicitrate binding protein FerR (iron transport regulator)
MEVTLIEGSVQVSAGTEKALRLSPGEQSQLNRSGELVRLKEVDLDGVMAWKNGKFDFGVKSDIGNIMRQIARWYNLELEFRGNIDKHFGGSISRDVNLSQVLKILEATRDVRFQVMGKKVIVMP